MRENVEFIIFTILDIILISLVVSFLLYCLLYSIVGDCFLNHFRGALVGATLSKHFMWLNGDI
jgi:hypothetical protein